MNFSPFRQVLGADFVRLPAPVQHVHGLDRRLVFEGRSEISAARGMMARIACALLGLPRPGSDVPVSVDFEPIDGGRERWQRRFADRGYRSTMAAGKVRTANRLIERFGWFDLIYTLDPEPRGLVWRMVDWRLVGIPLPRWAMPRTLCIEGGDGERFTFDIDVHLALVGWLIHYKGWLVPRQA